MIIIIIIIIIMGSPQDVQTGAILSMEEMSYSLMWTPNDRGEDFNL
jgi:hypothetical protein